MPDGGDAVKALSWADVDAIREQFSALNPYSADAVPGSVLEIEDENFEDHARTARKQLYCYAISAKRYALYTLGPDGGPVLRKSTDDRVGEKWSEHGLGHLLNPTDPDSDDRDWIRALWELELRRALGRPDAAPAWLPHPAVGQVTVGKPQTLDPFETFNHSKPYREQVKPFNFLLTAHLPDWVAPPTEAELDDGPVPASSRQPQAFQLIAPFERLPNRWLDLAWRNKYARDGGTYSVTTADQPEATETVRIQSFRDVLAEYRVHPEAKSRAPDGGRSGWHAIGLLRRRPVKATRIAHIGKESNDLDDTQARVTHEISEVVNQHVTSDEWNEFVLPVLAAMTRAQRRELGLSGSNVSAVSAGTYNPTPRTKRRLTSAAGEFARASLRAAGIVPPGEPVDCCAAYLNR